MPKRIFGFTWSYRNGTTPSDREDDQDESPYTRNGYDLCIHCRKVTRYTTNTPVQLRMGYIEGAGQLCENCIDMGKKE